MSSVNDVMVDEIIGHSVDLQRLESSVKVKIHKELKKLEGMMVQALADNCNLSVGDIYNMMSGNTDAFFSAEEALEMGLVDKII